MFVYKRSSCFSSLQVCPTELAFVLVDLGTRRGAICLDHIAIYFGKASASRAVYRDGHAPPVLCAGVRADIDLSVLGLVLETRISLLLPDSRTTHFCLCL